MNALYIESFYVFNEKCNCENRQKPHLNPMKLQPSPYCVKLQYYSPILQKCYKFLKNDSQLEKAMT